MIIEQTRSLNNLEKKTITERLTWNEKEGNKLFPKFIISVIIALLILISCIFLLFTINLLIVKVLSGIITVALIVFFILSTSQFLHWRKYHQNFNHEIKPKFLKALKANQVNVKKIEASSVYLVEQYEDEGNAYIFNIGEHNSLFLKGQEYEFAENNNKWPNSNFEIVHIPSNNEMLGIFAYGAKLKPKKIINSNKYISDDYLYGSFEKVINQPPEEFIKTLLR